MKQCAAPQPSDAARKHAQQQRILYQRGQQGGAFERVAPSKGEARNWKRSGRFQKRVCSAPSAAGVNMQHQEKHRIERE